MFQVSKSSFSSGDGSWQWELTILNSKESAKMGFSLAMFDYGCPSLKTNMAGKARFIFFSQLGLPKEWKWHRLGRLR